MLKRKLKLILLIVLTLVICISVNGISAADIEDLNINSSNNINTNIEINEIYSSQNEDIDFNLTDNTNYQKENNILSAVNSPTVSAVDGSEYENQEYIVNNKPINDTTPQEAVEITDEVNTPILEDVGESNVIYISPNGKGNGTDINNPTNWTNALLITPENGTIYFLPGTYYINNQIINRTLTLSSINGEVKLDAEKKGSTFVVLENNKLLTINGLTFINGTGYNYNTLYGVSGGSIFSLSPLVINNSKFYDNYAKTFGGSVFSLNNILVYNSSFQNNNCSNMGACVYSYSGAIEIYNCGFINNSANYSGVVLAAANTVKVLNSTFINNTLRLRGCVKGYNINVNSSTFINNYVTEGEASVISAQYDVVISNCVLINNSASGNCKVIEVSQIGNKVEASYNWWGDNNPFVGDKYGNLISEKGTFIRPANWVVFSVSSAGNLIKPNLNYYTTGNGDYVLFDSILGERTVFYNETGNISSGSTLKTSKYYGNSSSLTARVDNQDLSFNLLLGDKFYVNNSYTGFSNGTVDHPFNNLSYAIEVANNQNNNVTVFIMGGTYNDVNMTVYNNLTLSNYNNGNVILDARKNGYMFYVNETSNVLTIKGLNFFNGIGYDKGNTSGGAIYSGSKLIVINSNFINNTVTGYGGAICVENKIIITNSSFINNSANFAGAIFSYSSSNISPSVISGSLFHNNSANSAGGAIYFKKGDCFVNQSIFTNNKASAAGALGCENNLNIINSVFKNNVAIYNGGAVTADKLNITYSIIVNNTAYHLAKDLIGNNVYADYNWWGDNNPFNDTNNHRVLGKEDYISPNNWFVMDLTINKDNFLFDDNAVLTVTLNQVMDLNGGTSKLTGNNSLPEVNVEFTSDNNGHFQPSNDWFVNDSQTVFTPTQSGTDTLHANIDGMILNIPISVKLLETSITNNELVCENGTVTVYIVSSDGSIVDTGSVNIFYNNKAIGTAYVHNGKAVIKLDTLPDGTYNVIAFYFGKNPYDSDSKSLNLTVFNNRTTILTGNDLNITYSTPTNYTGRLVDANGNPIIGQHIALNLTRIDTGKSKVYWVTTDLNGEFQLPINLAPAQYTIFAQFYGDKEGKYDPSNATINNIIVNKASSTLVTNMFNHTFNAGLNFTGKLYINNTLAPIIGQHIALNLTRLSSGASKVYWVTTDVNGEFQLPINLSVGNYTINCSYSGSHFYNPSIGETSIKVY